jgi:hypothetical protein
MTPHPLFESFIGACFKARQDLEKSEAEKNGAGSGMSKEDNE